MVNHAKTFKCTINIKTILALTTLFGLLGCQIELPSPPPNVLYKFNVLRVGNGPADILTTDLNLDGSFRLSVR